MISRSAPTAAALALLLFGLHGAARAQTSGLAQQSAGQTAAAADSFSTSRDDPAAGSVPLSPESLLDEMNAALGSRGFSGTLVVFRDGRLDALRIERFRAAGGWKERISSLSGESIELERSGEDIRVDADGEVSTWSSGADAAIELRPRSVPAAHYELVNYGTDRVAGRSARVIDIRPRDGFRYGYRLWLDAESSLPLKSLTIGSDGRPIEQFMFASIELMAPQADAARASAAANGRGVSASGASGSTAKWKVLDAPAGFSPVVVEAGRRTHFLFTDGVARVSVYVEPISSSQPNLSGQLGRGAMHAFGRVAHGQQIIVMGDAPAATVERLAQGLVPNSAAADR